MQEIVEKGSHLEVQSIFDVLHYRIYMHIYIALYVQGNVAPFIFMCFSCLSLVCDFVSQVLELEDIKWHFIGHLQRNKCNNLTGTILINSFICEPMPHQKLNTSEIMNPTLTEGKLFPHQNFKLRIKLLQA